MRVDGASSGYIPPGGSMGSGDRRGALDSAATEVCLSERPGMRISALDVQAG